jgi:hypothetical protein
MYVYIILVEWRGTNALYLDSTPLIRPPGKFFGVEIYAAPRFGAACATHPEFALNVLEPASEAPSPIVSSRETAIEADTGRSALAVGTAESAPNRSSRETRAPSAIGHLHQGPNGALTQAIPESTL